KRQPLPPSRVPGFTTPWGGEAYREVVEVVKEHIRAGDAFQVVPSQRFEAPCSASALDVYRVLRATNPSPYMYLLRIPGDDPGAFTTDHGAGGTTAAPAGGFDIVGSSPEALVKVEDGRAMLHPIAGT
ncbi:hypothetical protein FNQ90_25890, partial [Streptomyces alkaliphilus]